MYIYMHGDIYIYIVSRESYQSTSIMRWDRGIFDGPTVAVSRDEHLLRWDPPAEDLEPE
jgi:hypothetical protein